MAQLTTEYVDLSNLSATHVKAKLLQGPNDMLQMCAEHVIPDVTQWDQALSAMACVAKWSPVDSFLEVVSSCTCEGQHTSKNLQGVAFLGLAGLLVVGKAATEVNKSYLVKRWTAYCESSSITNELSPAGFDSLTRIAMTAQPKLHQTATEHGHSM